MLVLSRKVGEQVVIDGRITITVNRVQGNRVSLGIAAPSDVRVFRAELTEPALRLADDESGEIGEAVGCGAKAG